MGFITLRDPETGEVREVDTRHRKLRSLFESRSTEAADTLVEGLRRAGVDQLPVKTGESYVTSIHRFFRMRERRFR